jgi:hypothetical protein
MKGIPIAVLAKIVDPVFRENYVGGINDDPYDEDAGDSLESVLYDMTGADDGRIISALIAQLIEDDDYWPPDGEEPFYSEDYRYNSDNYALGKHGRLWARFRESLLHGQRFFNTDAKELMAQIFAGVHQQRDVNQQYAVYLVNPGDPQGTFFRARIANDRTTREKIAEDLAANLGPPPERLRRPGRLNPSGIMAFYAAFDFDTCVAELRPSVGSVVVGAQFQITEPICVLDTTRFDAKPKEPNLFAPGALSRVAQWRFMQAFMKEIAQPISPGDEHLDYIPTQAVAEYLVRHHNFKIARRDCTIDAIIYRSAQRPEGRNIAILGNAAVVGVVNQISPQKARILKDDEFSLFGWSREEPKRSARIIPIVASLEKRIVRGAHFTTNGFAEGIDDWD